MKGSILRIICFLTVLAAVLYAANEIFRFKYDDGIYSLTKFYEQDDDSVDLLILGSSHAFAAFNTGVLWDKAGIASYDLCGSMQPLWNTYYYFKEALKTQKPRLLVLEAFMVTHDDDYIFYGSTIKNTFGMKLSPDKLRAVSASVPKEMRTEYLMEYTQYHNRYRELNRSDFNKEASNAMYPDWKGFMANLYIESYDDPDIGGVYSPASLHGKSEEYFRKILQLANDRGIPVLVVLTPYAGVTAQDMEKFERAGDIAREYGADFINYNKLYKETGIDYRKDVSDEGHLNYWGSKTFTEAFADYLKENYELPDRRNEKGYDSWKNNAAYVRAKLREMELTYEDDFSEYAGLLETDDFIIVSCPKDVSTYNEQLEKLGIETAAGESGDIWYKLPDTEDMLHVTRDEPVSLSLYGHEISLGCQYNDDLNLYSNSVIIDGKEYNNKSEGMNITVYNRITDSVVSDIGMDPDDGYKLIR